MIYAPFAELDPRGFRSLRANLEIAIPRVKEGLTSNPHTGRSSGDVYCTVHAISTMIQEGVSPVLPDKRLSCWGF